MGKGEREEEKARETIFYLQHNMSKAAVLSMY